MVLLLLFQSEKLKKMSKFCPTCNIEKNLTEFYFRKDMNYYRSECKECWKVKTSIFKKEIVPWRKHFYAARRRCEIEKDSHYKTYGGRGIKFLLTMEEIQELWFRDKAYNLKQPSIDRIRNHGNYEVSNCQFIEWKLNTDKRIPNAAKRVILQFSRQGKFIKEWLSISEARDTLGIALSNIVETARNRRKSAGGFNWRYK